MSNKRTCPGCDSHTSSVWHAVEAGEDCPHCGLSCSAIIEIDRVQESRANETAQQRLTDVLIDRDRWQGRAIAAERALAQIRQIADRDRDKAGYD